MVRLGPFNPNMPAAGMTTPISDPVSGALRFQRVKLIEMNDDIGFRFPTTRMKKSFSFDDYSGCLWQILCKC